MPRHSAYIKLVVALVWTSLTLFEGSTFAQCQGTRSDSQQEEVAPSQGSRSSSSEDAASEREPVKPEDEVADEALRPSDLTSEIDTLKAENAVIRELLRKLEEQQRALLEQIDRMQRRLDGIPTAAELPSGPSQAADAGGEPVAADANAPMPAPNAGNASGQQASVEEPEQADRYRDGIIIWENPEDAKVPFLLKFNNNTQIRYLNTLDSEETFTDHLGVVREVHRRNDITVNRSMFIFAGYMFDPKLQYSLMVWTSAGAASIIVAGNVGWRFNDAFTLTGGYTGVPGSRSLVNTFPFFQPTDRRSNDSPALGIPRRRPYSRPRLVDPATCLPRITFVGDPPSLSKYSPLWRNIISL